MDVNVYSLNGSVKGKIRLPISFSVSYRPRLILRAVLSAQTGALQPKGTMPHAGRYYTAIYKGVRKVRNSIMGHRVARKPHTKNRRNLLEGKVAGIPGVVKGPRAHPPRVDNVIVEKINKKERRLALLSALSALSNHKLVESRGHKFNNELTLPIVVESQLEAVAKTKDVVSFMEKIGVYSDVIRSKESKNVRAGRGKSRGRRYKTAKSVLFVVSDNQSKLIKAARNIEGVDVVCAKNLSVKDIAPGGSAGRLTIFAEKALENI